MLRTLLIGVLCLGMALAQFCRPEEDCWPSKDLIMELGKSLKGNIVMPSNIDYKNLTAMKNTLETKRPAFVVLPRDTKDVQKAIIFAAKHNIQPKIFSSGHSYVGRSTGNDVMMINFAKMKKITPYPGASVPFITVQPGVNWGQVYKEADKVKHIVVGGSAQTVSPSGCTLGGCHSPMSRMLGLAADNVLAYTAVTANGSIVQMTKRDKMGTVEDRYGSVSRVDTSDLFWALRGGGGAFAILTNITFKMHKPPKGFVRVVCSWKYDVAREFLNHYNAKVEKLPPQWGGYLLFQNRASLGDSAGVIMAMLHYGPWNSPTTAAIQQLTDFMPDSRQYCFPVNYTTFYEYEKNINDPTGFRTNIYNRFLGKGHFTTGLTNSLVNQFESADYYKLPFGCTWTHIGGTVSEQPANSTAVGPDFRNALVSLSCGPAWTEKKDDENIGRFMRAFGADLHKYGRGVYYNEPGRYLKNFTEEFWRGKYSKLLSIKKKWDPKNLFTCFQCVDSGKGPNATKLTMWLTTLTLALALLF